MLFSTKWISRGTTPWPTSLARLFQTLELAGCEVESDIGQPTASQASFELRVPGWDELLFTLPGKTDSMSDTVTHAIAQFTQERMRIEIDHSDSSLRCEWTYGTPFQMALHLAISMIFALGWVASDAAPIDGLIGIAAGNLVVLAFSGIDAFRTHQLFRKAGFVRSR